MANLRFDEMSRPEEFVSRAEVRWDWKRLTLVTVLIALLAAVFTAFNWQQSRIIGRLSSVPNYDDVTYLNWASDLYFEARTSGLRVAASRLLAEDTHSPFSVLSALCGYVLFGPSVAKIYWMLAVVAVSYLGFVAALGRRLPVGLLLGLLVASLGLPFASMGVLEFRPDLMWAIVLCGSSVLFLIAERPFEKRRVSIAYGIALGISLLAKPSTFAMTFLVMGGTWFLAAVSNLVCRSASWKLIARGLALTLFTAFVISSWYLIPHGRETLDYFYSNSFGERRDVWIYRGDLWERLTFYVRGVALESNLGTLLPLLATLYVAGAVSDLRKGCPPAARMRGFSFLWMLAGLFLVNAVFSMKSPFLGGAFYGYLIFGAIWQAARGLEAMLREGWIATRSRRVIAVAAVISVGWAGYSFPAASEVNIQTRAWKKSINRSVLRELLSDSNGKSETTVVFTQGNPLVWEYLQMEFRTRKRDLKARPVTFVADPQRIIAAAERADYILLQDQELLGIPGFPMPAEKFQPDLIRHFSGSSDWQLVKKFPDPNGKFVYLFGKRNPLP